MAQKNLSLANSLILRIFMCCCIFLFLILTIQADAAIRTWTNGSGNGLWNTPGNWTGAAVPTAIDDVIFDGTSTANCNINVAVNVLSFQINAGYTGTVSQGANVITVGTGGFTIASGTFSGGNRKIDVTGIVTMSGGTFTSTSDTLVARKDFINSGVVFNHNNGLTLFDLSLPAGAPTFTVSGTTSFYNCQFSSSLIALGTLTHIGTSTILNDLIIAVGVSGRLLYSGGAVHVKKDVIVVSPGGIGPAPGQGGGDTELRFNGTGTQRLVGNVAFTRSQLPNTVLDKSASDTLIVLGTPTLGGDFDYIGGIINTIGTLGFQAATTGSFNITGNPFRLSKIHFSQSNYIISPTAIITVDSLFEISSSSASFRSGNIILNGDFYTGCINRVGGGDATVTIQGSGTQYLHGFSIVAGGSLPNVVINKAATDSLIIDGTGFVNVNGDFTYNDGIIAGNGRLVFNSNGIGGHIQSLTINHPSGVCRLPNSGIAPWQNGTPTQRNIDVGKTLLIENEFNMYLTGNSYLNGGTIEVHGDIICTNTGADAQSGGTATVLINGSANQNMIGNGFSVSRLPNIRIDKPSGTLTLQDTIAVSGNWEYIRGDVDDATFQSGVAFWTPNKTINLQGTVDSMLFYNMILGDLGAANTRTMLSNVTVRNILNLSANKLNLNQFQLTLLNPLPTAIQFTFFSTNYGSILSETAPPLNYGYVRWNVDNSSSGTYTIPFINPTNVTRAPFSFIIQSGGSSSGTGAIRVSTYRTDWTQTPNNQPLPYTVTNLNNVFGIDNSFKMIDRFWTVEALDYSSPPVIRKGFGYYEREWAFINNIISEYKLQEHRWNAAGPSWIIPPGTATVDTVNNIVTTAATGNYGIFTLVDPSPPDLLISASDSSVCVGASIDFFDGNATTPTTSSWQFSGGAPATSSATDPTGIVYNTAGTFDVILIANYSGNIVRDTFSNFITVANGPSLVLDSVNASCNGANDAKIWGTASNGANYVFAWTPSAGVAGPLGDSIRNLSPGQYALALTDTSGCIVRDTATVSEPPAITIIKDSLNVICFGGGGGKAWVTASGGTPSTPGRNGYVYTWSAGVSSTSTPADTAYNLTPGNYSVTVRDGNGCIAVATFAIAGPLAGINVVLAKTDPLCNGDSTGKVWATVTGGSPNYTYSWSRGVPVPPVNDTVGGIWAGLVSVTVTDANLCTATASITVNEPTITSTTVVGTDALCNGQASGRAYVNASGGTPSGAGAGGYTYSWSAGTPVGPNNDTVTGLPAGTHYVTVRDANLCETLDSVLIGEPTAISLTTDFDSVQCFGGSDGRAWVTAIGGTPSGAGPAGYGYTWSPALGTPAGAGDTLAGIPVGTYTVIVEDDNGCSVSTTVTVGGPAAVITIAKDSTNVICFNGNEGEAIVTVTGGTPSQAGPQGYTYTWTPNVSVNDTAKNLTGGTYTVVVSDARGCIDSVTFNIQTPSAGITLVMDSADVTCAGIADGTIWATASGGTPSTAGPAGYVYQWSAGTTSSPVADTISGLSTGVTYRVTVTDANGCTAVDSATVGTPVSVTATAVTADLSCFGDTTGIIAVTATGGTPSGPGASGYSYGWTPSSITTNVVGDSAVNLPAGIYTVRITDVNGCFFDLTDSILQPPALVLDMDSQAVACNGGSDGKIWVTVSGGTPNYSLAWSAGTPTGPNNDTITGLTAGCYTVTVTDGNGCVDSATACISEPAALVLDMDSVQVTCNGGADGEVSVLVSGGTASYSYLWSNSGTTSTLTGLGAGCYTVTVTDGNGCVDSATACISEPAAIQLSLDSINISCADSADGVIWLTVVGGTAPYTYTWSGGTPVSSADTIINLTPGCYSVTLTDNNGCTATATACVSQPAAISLAFDITDVLCNGDATGRIVVTASGGTPAGAGPAGYGYNWIPPVTTLGAGDTVVGLFAGTYVVEVTDANGCLMVDSATVTEPTALQLDMDSLAVSCNGGNDGKIWVTVSGGTPNYTIAWGAGTPTGPNNDTITGLIAGCFTVTVTDGNGCIDSATACISEPTPLVLDMDSIQVSCADSLNGSVWVVVSGGTSSYSYLWSNGEVSDTITGLGAGCYTVTVTDFNGCIDSATACISEPAPISFAFDSTEVSCNGFTDGSIWVVISGGNSPYTYQWSGGTTGVTDDTIVGLGAGCYTLTITDATGCQRIDSACISEPTAITLNLDSTDVLCFDDTNGIIVVTASGGAPPYTYTWPAGVTTGVTADTAINLGAGCYVVTVTDFNGCVAIDSTCVLEPPLLATAMDSVEVSCFGGSDGSVWVTVIGGTPNYTYNWSGGTPVGNGDTITGLSAGCYFVTITDANGCFTVDSACISEPTLLVTAMDSIGISCFGGADGVIWVVVSGGTSPYNYLWSGGTPVPTGDTIIGLSSGCYFVTITDANGCIVVDSACVTEPTQILTSLDSTNVLCSGDSTGRIVVTATGGTPGYTYLWPTGVQTLGIGDTAINLTAGCYVVTVTDANGCQVTDSTCILEPTPLALTLDSIEVSCFGFTDGSVWVTATGGVAPYNYAWSGGAPVGAGDTITGLPVGCYTVTVTDANGCIDSATACISEPPLLTTVMDSVEVSCFGGTDGKIWVTPGGGAPPYTISWSAGTPSGPINDTITGLAAGCYFVTVTDDNGCIAVDSACISEPTELVLAMDSIEVSCFGGADGAVWVTATGGTPPYQYLWNNGSTSDTINGLAAGCYIVTVIDDNGCTAVDSACISEPTQITLALGGVNILCNGDTNGEAWVIASGGTPSGVGTGYTYSWTGPASNPTPTTNASGDSITNLSAGWYVVDVSDDNGCIATDSIEITEPTVIALTFDGIDILCNGDSTGRLVVTATGGTPFSIGGPAGYTYTWSPSATALGAGDTIVNLIAGTYAVTVTDSTNCSVVDSFTINQPAQAIAIAADSIEVSCFGGSDGKVWVTATGGTPSVPGPAGYSYSWIPTGTTSGAGDTLTGLVAGCYQVVVSDANSCTDTIVICISEPTELTLSIDSTNVDCFGASTGRAWVAATGGTPNGAGVQGYTYNWNGPVGNPTPAVAGFGDTIITLIAGQYTVVVTDDSGCQETATVNITEPTAIALNPDSSNVSCNGGSDGKAWVNVAGGTPAAGGYVINWPAPVATNNDTAINLAAGSYAVTVTDSLLCEATITINITEPTPLVLAMDSVNVFCFGDATGKAWVIATGGTTTYTYNWPTGTTPGLTNDTIINLLAGSYTVTVVDFNGCTDSLTVNITEPATAVTTAKDSSNVNCFGGSDGIAWVTPIGGTPVPPGGPAGYTYQWSPAGVGTQSAIGDTLKNLPAGSYSVVITDALGCSITEAFNITEPATAVTLVKDSLNVACFGDSTGKAWVTVSGGTPSVPGATGYTYNWSNGTVAGAAGDSIINLSAGVYRVTVTDANGCTLSTVFNITQSPQLVTTTTKTDVSCFGGNDGVGRITVTGGQTPYTIVWGGGVPSANGDSTTGLIAGTYGVTVTDVLGCIAEDSVIITEPAAPLTIVLDSIDVNCFGGNDGRAWVGAQGGTPFYTYNWSGGTAIGAGDTIINLTANTYSVTVTDANGCTTVGSIVVNEPAAPLAGTLDFGNVTCNGAADGRAWIDVTGGTPNYVYAWSGGTPTANGDTTTGLAPGTYFVTVTDANGCTLTDQVTITQPDELLLSIVVDSNTNCYGGATGGLTVSLTGGTGPYDYLWSTTDQTLGSSATSNSIANLTVGQYAVTVVDANGCSKQITEVIVERPGPQFVSTQIDSTICDEANGVIMIMFTTSDPPLSYSWSHNSALNTPIVTELAVGSYTVTVSDASMCDTVMTVEVPGIDEPEIDTVIVKESYCGNGDGQITVTMLAGSPPYQYSWSHDATLASGTATDLPPGNYTVTVVDDRGCSTEFDTTITETAAPELGVDPLPTQVIFNGQTLEVLVELINPIDSIAYLWNPADDVTCLDDDCLNANLSPSVSTTFTLVATDIETGCTDTLYYNVVVRDEDNIFIPNAITPNGDGVNDVWVIRDLETFPDNEVIIINRWGDEVFRAAPYLNDWGGLNKGGGELPAGTYYYIVKLNEIDGSITGPMTIIK